MLKWSFVWAGWRPWSCPPWPLLHPTPALPPPNIARATTLSRIASVTLVLIALLQAFRYRMLSTLSLFIPPPNLKMRRYTTMDRSSRVIRSSHDLSR